MECFVLEGRKFVRLPEEEIGELVNQKILKCLDFVYRLTEVIARNHISIEKETCVMNSMLFVIKKEHKLGILKLAFIFKLS